MKTFSQFCSEAYDADVMGSSQIKRVGDRIGTDRKKTDAEIRRTKRVGGGQTVPAKRYKKRSDAGEQRGSQGPELKAGTAGTQGSAAMTAKERQRKAYLERKKRESGGESKVSSTELTSQAKKLTSKKKAAPEREKQVKMTKGEYTRAEKVRIKREGRRKLRDLVLQSTGKKKEGELKHKYTSSGDES